MDFESPIEFITRNPETGDIETRLPSQLVEGANEIAFSHLLPLVHVDENLVSSIGR